MEHNHKHHKINHHQVTSSISQLLRSMGHQSVSQLINQQANLPTQLSNNQTNHNQSNLHPTPILAQIFKTIFPQKQKHIFPIHKVFTYQGNHKILCMSVNNFSNSIAFVDKTNLITIIKKNEQQSTKKEQRQLQISCLNWINEDILVSGNVKGEIKIWEAIRSLKLQRRIITHNHQISKIICEKEIIYSQSQNQLVIITHYQSNNPWYLNKIIIPYYNTFIKVFNKDCLVGIYNQGNKLSIFDLTTKVQQLICNISQGKYTEIVYNDKNKKQIYLMLRMKSQIMIECWNIHGSIYRKIQVIINKNMLKQIGGMKFINFDWEKQSFILSSKFCKQIYYYGLKSNTILYTHTQQQQDDLTVQKIEKMFNNEIAVLRNNSLDIYSTVKSQLNVVKPKRQQTHRHIFSNIPQDIAILIRTLRQRNPQGLNFNFFLGDNQEEQFS